MKRVLFAGATLFALASAHPAVAQPMPVFNWTGLYVGATVGYGWGSTYQFDTGGRTPDFNWSGAVAGGTLGYNWQVGALVFGIETDISWSGIRGTTSNVPGGWVCGPPNGCINQVDWFGTVRGRAGFAANQALFYVTGGVAYGHVYAEYGGGCVSACISSTNTGWTGGAGLEWAFAPNWSIKVEYLYIDLGSAYDPTPNFGVVTKFNVVRLGANVRF